MGWPCTRAWATFLRAFWRSIQKVFLHTPICAAASCWVIFSRSISLNISISTGERHMEFGCNGSDLEGWWYVGSWSIQRLPRFRPLRPCLHPGILVFHTNTLMWNNINSFWENLIYNKNKWLNNFQLEAINLYPFSFSSLVLAIFLRKPGY